MPIKVWVNKKEYQDAITNEDGSLKVKPAGRPPKTRRKKSKKKRGKRKRNDENARLQREEEEAHEDEDEVAATASARPRNSRGISRVSYADAESP